MKNMIKSIVACVAMTLFASVGLASTNITFCVGEKAEFTYSGSGTPTVMTGKSTPANWDEFITFSAASGKVTFQGKLDTPSTNTVTITLAMNGADKGPGMPSDNKYIFTVKTVEIEKTIMAWNNPNEALTFPERYDPDNKSNSTIRVVTHVLKGNITTRDPNVLFLGTRCGAHDLKRETVVKSINALLSIGNVDYYLFDSDTTATAKADDTYTGKKVKGQTVTASDIYSSEFPTEGNHSALSGFYNELYKIATDDNTHMRAGEVYKYDYIVIETDGTRLAHKYALEETETQLAKMKRVAEYLAPFYEDKKMIWVLDNGFDYYYNDLSTSSRNYFYYATEAGGYSQEIYQYGRTNETDVANTNAYRVNNGYIRNSGQQNQYFNRLDDLAWRAFVGIFDPSLYLDNVTNKTTQFYVESKSADVRVSTGSSSYGRDKLELYAGHEYEIQTWYDNAESLGDYLKEIVKPIPFNAVIADSVVQTYGGVDDMGLSLIDGANSVRFYEVNTENWKPGDPDPDTDDTNAWVAVTSGWGVNTETMAVTATVKRIVSEWWNKIEVDIEDDGTFFAKCLKTGRYEGPDENGNYLLNPNKDEATVELYDDTGKLLTKRSGAVDPTQQWEFEPRDMIVDFRSVEKKYDGIPTNICLVSVKDAVVTSSNITEFCSISNSFDEVTWYEMDEFPGLLNATVVESGDETPYASNVYWKVCATGYNTTNGVNTITIKPRKVTMTSATVDDHEYNGVTVSNGTVTVTGDGFIDADTNKVHYAVTASQTDVGTTNNVFSYTFDDDVMKKNYSVKTKEGTLKVSRAPIMVKAEDDAKVYGQSDPDFAWDLDLDSMKTRIAMGETNDVYSALSNVVELVRCPEKGETVEQDVGTYENVITTNTPFAVQTTGVLKNYKLDFTAANFTITPAQIIPLPDDPKATTNVPWAQALSVDVCTNRYPAVVKVGTNIVTRSGAWHYKNDAKNVKYEFSFKDLPVDSTAWKSAAAFQKSWLKAITYQSNVFCRVSCGANYYPTNVMATVTIRSLSTEIDNSAATDANDKIKNRTDTKDALDEILADIYRGEYAGSGISWQKDEGQIDGIVRVKSTTPPTASQSQAQLCRQNAIALYKQDNPEMVNVNGRALDIDLEYESQLHDDREADDSIGDVNTTMVPFRVNFSSTSEVRAVYVYHGPDNTDDPEEILRKGSAGSGEPWYQTGVGYIDIASKRFSIFVIVTADEPKPEACECLDNIYDYKASVKYVDFKKINAKSEAGVTVPVWIKVVKNASLKGYLVTPQCCSSKSGERVDQGPGFLVIQNSAMKKWNTKYGVSQVKLMPANLFTEWWATTRKANKNISLQAQGYLFAGVGKRDVPDPYSSPFYGLGDYDLYPVTKVCGHEYRTAGTQFLFGEMNVSEDGEFIEPFLDHSGFGKAKYRYDATTEGGEDHPCIFDPKRPVESERVTLENLSGTLIGGSYACLRNASVGHTANVYCAWPSWNVADNAAENWLCQGWDDKRENAYTVKGSNNLQQEFNASTKFMYNVICGTWSIKANSSLIGQCNIIEDVVRCGQKIDVNFSLDTFDRTNKDEFNKLVGNFFCKWFDKYSGGSTCPSCE